MPSRFLLTLALFATWLIVVLSIESQSSALWGLHSSQYLDRTIIFTLLALSALLSLWLAARKSDPQYCANLSKRLVSFIWGEQRWPIITIALFAGTTFTLSMSETHFLGDGYTWLANYSNPDAYVHKWTEPLSIHFLRALQTIMGGYTQETALYAFRAISVVSGIVATYYAIRLIGTITEQVTTRLLGLTLWFTSGALLLFFGYVEFYPPLWATGIAFFYYSLRALKNQATLTPALISLALGIAVHLQFLYLMPGVLYLIYSSLSTNKKSQKLFVNIALAVTFAALVTFVYSFESFRQIFLPLFTGRENAPDYAIFSPSHLFDIANLLLLITPSALVLLALSISQAKNTTPDKSTRHINAFLTMTTLSSLLFLLTIDPAIGLARDWDLFSFTIAPLTILLFIRVTTRKPTLNLSAVTAIALLGVFATGSFLATNLTAETSTARYHDLLNHYGSKDRSGWTILMRHYRKVFDEQSVAQVSAEMRRYFPEDQIIIEIIADSDSGKFAEAIQKAQYLVKRNPENANFLQIMGSVCGKIGATDSALKYYNAAIALRPKLPAYKIELLQILFYAGRYTETRELIDETLPLDPTNRFTREFLARTQMKLGHTDSAHTTAESLLTESETAHIGEYLKLLLFHETNQTDSAKFYYNSYYQSGSHHYQYYDAINRYGALYGK